MKDEGNPAKRRISGNFSSALSPIAFFADLQLFKILHKLIESGERGLTPWHFIRKKWELLINTDN